MAEYIIITDSGCDISPEILEKWGVKCIDLNFKFTDEAREYTPGEVPLKEFYAKMRDGKVAKTSAANSDVFLKYFDAMLAKGNDILYVGFSSGLSSTVGNAGIAADELCAKYPERKIEVIDTLCASAGEGLILYYAVREKKNGASLENAAKFVRDRIHSLCHWFTVDDLVYLKRGGRIDPKTAFVATVLNIKPVLHMDDEGHLINMGKVHGRKTSIRALLKKYSELALDPDEGIYFISHGDCIDDAKLLDSMIFEKYGHHAGIISDIGPVIGAHSGPGTLALFFLGRER
ncbi:MAG: DegV family protein [Clostridia bacterium]|nr:DegV family protein [Clostridia bacterium]